jgi:hypothetical protein
MHYLAKTFRPVGNAVLISVVLLDVEDCLLNMFIFSTDPCELFSVARVENSGLAVQTKTFVENRSNQFRNFSRDTIQNDEPSEAVLYRANVIHHDTKRIPLPVFPHIDEVDLHPVEESARPNWF